MFRGLLWNWLPWIFNQVTWAADVSKRVAVAAYTEAAISKEWVFLHAMDIPICSKTFKNIPTDQIRWRAQTNPPKFVNPSSTETTLKHVSYLALSIFIPGQDTIELTDWINEVKWQGIIQPSVIDLFILWCYETGSPHLHLIKAATAEIITADGTTIRKGLNESARSLISQNGSEHQGQGFDSNRLMDALLSSSGC